jgi:hypothetical protein
MLPSSFYSTRPLPTKGSSLPYNLPSISPHPVLAMMTMPTLGISDKLDKSMSTLFLNTPQAATIKADTIAILKIDDDIEEYCREL